MARVEANGIALEYEIEGPEDAPVLLLIHGLGAQLVRWPRGLMDAFLQAGFRILRMDNRDVGLSSHFDHAGIPDLAQVMAAVQAGRVPEIPYTLSDMASDAVTLLQALGIGSAHVVGVSLGGMIAQVMAIENPVAVRSMTIMMSQSGKPELPGSNKQALALLTAVAPDPATDREGYLAHQVKLNRGLGSPAYPTPEDELRAYAGLAADRAYNPSGCARQLAASRGAADRTGALCKLDVPTLVIHGAEDILIPAICGEDIAARVPKSWFLKIAGMGHDLPAELFGIFTAAIAANCARIEGT